jgi:hypothetical protein
LASSRSVVVRVFASSRVRVPSLPTLPAATQGLERKAAGARIQSGIRNVETASVPPRIVVSVNGRLLLILVSLSVALAGCANNASDPNGEGGDVSPPAQTSPEQAKGLLDQAAKDPPQKAAARATVSKGSRTLMQMNGTFDNTTGTSFLQLSGDAEALGGLAGQGMGGGEAFAGLFANGVSIYTSPEGGIYLMNGTAFVFPPENASGRSSVGVPSPSESPFGAFLQPAEVMGGLADANVTVKSVNSTVYRGKPALQITLSDAETSPAAEPVVTLFTNPVRIARVEGVAPSDPESPADPFAGATFAVDFYYDNEVRLDVPPAATRALGLSYTSDQSPFGGDPDAPATWTFQAASGVPLAEVEVHVKDVSDADPSDVSGIATLPTLWSMKLSDGAKTQDGATLTFTDVDGDGKVSKGDTLRMEGLQGDRAVLYDAKTGTYVVPGPALLLALAGLGVAALLLRRR